MNISVSNIAWPAGMENQALALLREAGITAIEVAPTRLWPEWKGASGEAAAEAEREFASRGIRVSSLQAILFGRPDCRLFGSDNDRQSLLDHLALCASLACGLGAQNLVFGAPKNRALGKRSQAEAFQIACEFFRVAGGYFQERGVCLCLEPNPPQYECEFVVNSSQAARLVHAVDSPGFRLHLDTGCMLLSSENPVSSIRRHAEILRHFHVSEPFLASFDSPVIDHEHIAEALEGIGYSNWITLEMRATAEPLPALAAGARVLIERYRQPVTVK